MATDQYKKDGLGGSYKGPTLPEQDPSAVYMDEIQRAASEKNYKALLQSDIAAYNLKLKTQKYLDDMLADQGLGSSGYGTSAHVGVENRAANLYAQNLENYNQAQSDALAAAQERKSNEELDRDKALMNYLANSNGTDDSIDRYMKTYGYSMDENGNWTDKDGKPADPSVVAAAIYSKEQNADQTYANVPAATSDWLKGNVSTYQGADSNGYGSAAALSMATVGSQDNSKTDSLRNVVGDEIDAMEEWVNSHKDEADGTLFRLEREKGDHHETYLVLYVGGRYYIVSDDDREQDGRQVATRYAGYAGHKMYFKGGKEVK